MATKRIKALTTGTPAAGDYLAVDPVSGSTYKMPIGPGVNRIPFHAEGGRGVELKGTFSMVHLAGEFTVAQGGGRWFRLFQITLDGNYLAARGEIWFGRDHDGKAFSSRLGYYVGSRILPTSEARLALAPGLQASGESTTGVITDAAIVQVGSNTCELWVQVYTDVYPVYIAWHYHGAVFDTSKISYAPLQWASPPTPVSGGLNVQWSTLPSSSASLGWFGRIVESGSNYNGSYIRYDDGTQICWASHSPTSFGSVQTGTDTNYKYKNKTWGYPAAFAAAPIVITSGDLAEARVDVTNAYGVTTTQCILEAGQYNTTDVVVNAFYTFAIGRWK